MYSKWFIITVVLIGIMIHPFVKADECQLTERQMSIMFFSYSYGREHDLGYTLLAIALKESGLGQWNVNLQDPSASPWHVTVDKAVDKLGWRHTPFNMNRATQRLIEDPFLGASIAVEEIKNWYKIHDNVSGHERWRRTWASYNRGYNWHNSTGQAYADEINTNIIKARQCGWLDGVVRRGG